MDELRNKKEHEAIIQKNKHLSNMLDWRLNQLRKEQAVMSKFPRERPHPEKPSRVTMQTSIQERNVMALLEVERRTLAFRALEEARTQLCEVSL